MLGGGIELAAYLLAFVVLGGWGRQGPLVVYLALRNTNITVFLLAPKVNAVTMLKKYRSGSTLMWFWIPT